jgi:hypothetical protein
MLEKENTNEDVEPHAQIDEGDILNFLYNLLPHTSSQVERMGGVLFVIFFVAIPLLILLLKPLTLPHPPSPYEKVGGAFVLVKV